jgi:hypothetical protein
MTAIKVSEIVGRNAISIQSGRKLNTRIRSHFDKKIQTVEIDFDGVEIFASPFFNSSIGVFLKEMDVNQLLKAIIMKNLSENGRDLLNQVVANAIRFYKTEDNVSKVLDRNSDDE